jgi:fructuronate reductase
MRLDAHTLARLPAAVRRPAYDRADVTCGVVHLGIGAFHRAHQAVYLDDALAAGETSWGILGASLRSPGMRDALAPQDGLYTLSVRSSEREDLRVIGAVQSVVVAAEDTEALIARMTDPSIRIVSLTVTEKGYTLDPASGALAEDHPDVVHDLADLYHPRSALGFVTAALATRFNSGLPPFTVLSCDNLPSNGATVKRALDRFARLVSPDFGEWVAAEVCCPSTMVDRIVPATTDADRQRIAGALGLEDAWPVVTEPFSQWVVEDQFPAGRPDLAAHGVELVKDVRPYELMKLRLLNGSHSTLAYLGSLAGYETVAETVQDPAFERLVRAMMSREIGPTLTMPPGTDLGRYQAALIERFGNTALRHRTSQIAMDGTQKLPQRLLDTIRARLARNQSFGRLALGVAGWMRYVTGRDEHDRAYDVRDPMADRLAPIATRAGRDAGALADGLMGLRAVFGDDLPADPRFREAVTGHLADLFAKGARATVEATARD